MNAHEEVYLDLELDPHTGRTGLILGLSAKKRVQAKQQLEAYLLSLHHTDKISVVASIRLIRLLAAPEQLSRTEACRRLCDILAIQRDKQKWGRVWSFWKILAAASKEQRPIWNEDVEQWTPKKIARMRNLDMSAVTRAFALAKLRSGGAR